MNPASRATRIGRALMGRREGVHAAVCVTRVHAPAPIACCRFQNAARILVHMRARSVAQETLDQDWDQLGDDLVGF